MTAQMSGAFEKFGAAPFLKQRRFKVSCSSPGKFSVGKFRPLIHYSVSKNREVREVFAKLRTELLRNQHARSAH